MWQAGYGLQDPLDGMEPAAGGITSSKEESSQKRSEESAPKRRKEPSNDQQVVSPSSHVQPPRITCRSNTLDRLVWQTATLREGHLADRFNGTGGRADKAAREELPEQRK